MLDRHYVYKYCAPTRGALLTGRYPYHLCATRCNLIPSTSPEGIDLGYTYLPKALASAGYVSHHVGKWHQGFHWNEYTPVGRGFNTSYGFLQGGEDHYKHNCGASMTKCHLPGFGPSNGAWDLWEQGGAAGFPGKPLLGMNGTLDENHFTGSPRTYSPSQFRGTPDCNESAVLHSYVRPGCSLSLSAPRSHDRAPIFLTAGT